MDEHRHPPIESIFPHHRNDVSLPTTSVEVSQRSTIGLTDHESNKPGGQITGNHGTPSAASDKVEIRSSAQDHRPCERGFRRIVRNFTPSWFIITMSTGVISILLHQLPYNGHWLRIISVLFFVLNIVLFVLFTFISILRYIWHPELILTVLSHPHQSLFIAAFPVGLATLINMTVLVCVPAWGHGLATLAWILWWIDGVLALATCFHLTWVIMSNRRGELEEMTALYLIPIVAVVIVATSGGIVANALPNQEHRLWTLIVSFILWGLGSPLSWIILTIYLLRLILHKPVERAVIVSLLLPIGPLGLSGFSLTMLGKNAMHIFSGRNSLPHVAYAGDMLYVVGFLMGLILWGFAIVWFVVAVVMIATSDGFPFNMSWWGFIFPVGVFTLLTISIGEELESRCFKVLACVLTAACVLMWLVVAIGTVQRSISGKMFFAPCLGTNLYQDSADDNNNVGEDLKLGDP